MKASSSSAAAAAAAAASAAFSWSSSAAKAHPYLPPEWISSSLKSVPPAGRLSLANLPTPIHQVNRERACSDDGLTVDKESNSRNDESIILQRFADLDVTFLLKRDDMSGGVELGGNKVRKLEFLLADCLSGSASSTDAGGDRCRYNAVATIGGQQSNHCRATACAARMVGLEPHLILRTTKAAQRPGADGDAESSSPSLGVVGNLLLDRMVGSRIYTCTPGEYGRIGSQALVQRLCKHLEISSGGTTRAYPIPVGGSNGIGTWGYIQGVVELKEQWDDQVKLARDESSPPPPSLDHVVFACGSGGTAAGIALGLGLCPTLHPRVHAVGVCDDPNYFYNHVASIADEMGFTSPEDGSSTLEYVQNHMIVHQGKGLGYALSTPEELEFCVQFAKETGVALDPVYSSKALHHFVANVLDESFRGSTVLFWHTGGALGMYDKELPDVDETSPVRRLNVYGKSDDSDDGSVAI